MVEKKKKTSKHRRQPLSRERLLQRAMRLADASGIDSLSMRKLASEVGVEAMSLYNHVKSKDDLLDGMVDLVIGEFTVPALDGDWKPQMRSRALSAHEALLRHPWSPMLVMSRVNIGPAALRYVDATIGCLTHAGFSLSVADHAWNALDSYTYGFTLQQLSFPFQPDEYADVAEEYIPQIPADQYPYLVAMSEAVMQGRHDGVQQLSFGLELILDGLERLLEAGRK